MSDHLVLAQIIEEAGIERAKAERMASAIFAAIHENAATKADITAAHLDIGHMDAGITDARRDVGHLGMVIHENMATKADIAAAQASLKADITDLRSELKSGELLVVLAGLGLLVALRYWQPRRG